MERNPRFGGGGLEPDGEGRSHGKGIHRRWRRGNNTVRPSGGHTQAPARDFEARAHPQPGFGKMKSSKIQGR